jgi:hypothetical protein
VKKGSGCSGKGGDEAFHTTREAAEEEAGRLAGDLAVVVVVVPAVRFTSKAIERQRTQEDRTDTEASPRKRPARRSSPKD